MNQCQGQQQIFKWPNCIHVDIYKLLVHCYLDLKSLSFVRDIITVPIIYPFADKETEAKLKKTSEIILSFHS